MKSNPHNVKHLVGNHGLVGDFHTIGTMRVFDIRRMGLLFTYAKACFVHAYFCGRCAKCERFATEWHGRPFKQRPGW